MTILTRSVGVSGGGRGRQEVEGGGGEGKKEGGRGRMKRRVKRNG